MRENESDGEGGWPQPREYVSPWAPPDEDEAASTRWPGANATPPPENGHQDTTAFGRPASPRGGEGQSCYQQPGYGSQPGYGVLDRFRSVATVRVEQSSGSNRRRAGPDRRLPTPR